MITIFQNYCDLPTNVGIFRMYDTHNENVCLLSYSPIENIGSNPLVRIHSSCIASEVFGAKDCDCADQLHEAMKLIASEGNGLIIHIHQEGRGHGLSKKIKAVSLMQKSNCDTAESFQQLGLELDPRTYDEAVDILKKLGISSVRLISNNPRKKNFLIQHGITVEVVHTHPKIRPENENYLWSKNQKLGHTLPLADENETNEILFYHSDQKWGDFANFSGHPIFLDGKIWKTVEHFYQAQKFHGTELEESIRLQKTPMEAKQKSHEFLQKHPVPNWNEQKELVMYRAIKAKFTQNPELENLLIETGNKNIVERTDSDSYWGDGKDGTGKNRMGFLLMKLRTELRSKNLSLIEKHKSSIENFFNIESPLQLLGSGAEGLVFTDQRFVYKSFFDISDKDWSFLKEKADCFSKNNLLYSIDFFENQGFRLIRYIYEPSTPVSKVDPNDMINFLRFCKAEGFVFANINPKNFIQLKSGELKLIDYGRSFEPFTEKALLNSTKRAYLFWKYPSMANDEFQKITAKINKNESPKEIEGWETFCSAKL